MKATALLSLTLFFALFMIINSHNLQSEKEQHPQNETELKTYLVKTKLTKEELETLLAEGSTQLVNLKKAKKEKVHNVTVKEVTNATNRTEADLQKVIEQEIKEDALHPLHEFRVDQNEVKTLVTKPNARFIDSLYEKRFGKFYAYLTLILFVFVMIYYKDIIFSVTMLLLEIGLLYIKRVDAFSLVIFNICAVFFNFSSILLYS